LNDTELYDSARWGLIPENSMALLYADGRFTAPKTAVKRFRAVRWFTVLGGAGAARYAGLADYEPGNAVFTGRALQTWAQTRLQMNCRARVYTNLTNFRAAYSQVHTLRNVRYHIATLNDTEVDHELTAVQLMAMIHGKWGIKVDPGLIWAHQWWGGPAAPYDKSRLLGTW
jgi:hypothetical protein